MIGFIVLGVACTSSTTDTSPITDSGTSTFVPEGNDVSLDRFPPVVVQTTPAAGATNVDATTLEVRFSKRMATGGWSWVTVGSLPTPSGDVAYVDDRTHVMANVALDPDTTYLAWLNDPGGTFANFQDTEGRSSVAYPFLFTTAASDADFAGVPAAVVRTVPEAGSSGVDPSLGTIQVEMSIDVDPTTATLTADGPRTELDVVGIRGDVGRAFEIDVSLIPANTTAVWIEVDDLDGVPSAPYLLSFRTGFGE
ncbi:MAG: Ig-like domain-containing protein [Myxococcales bacterium]|nr:Ig-like domain-containing protein [Myxococcales bacterium]